MTRTIHPLAVSIAERRAAWQARAWLAAAREPDLVATEALRQLNRHAFATKHDWQDESNRIYYLKRLALRALFDAWPCKITVQEQTLICDGCSGRGYRIFGPPWDRRHEPCFNCRATGIYKVVQLYAFDFTVAGRSFRWHQPADLCGWAAKHVTGQGAPYVAPTWSAPEDRLTAQHVRVLLAVLEQWLAQRPLPLFQQPLYADAPGFRRRGLRQATAAELRLWRNVPGNLGRLIRYRWRMARRRLIVGGVLKDDLPF